MLFESKIEDTDAHLIQKFQKFQEGQKRAKRAKKGKKGQTIFF